MISLRAYVLKTPGLGGVSMPVARLADTSGQPAPRFTL